MKVNTHRPVLIASMNLHRTAAANHNAYNVVVKENTILCFQEPNVNGTNVTGFDSLVHFRSRAGGSRPKVGLAVPQGMRVLHMKPLDSSSTVTVLIELDNKPNNTDKTKNAEDCDKLYVTSIYFNKSEELSDYLRDLEKINSMVGGNAW